MAERHSDKHSSQGQDHHQHHPAQHHRHPQEFNSKSVLPGRKSAAETLHHHNFLESNESVEEEHHHQQKKKPRSRRYYEHVKELREQARRVRLLETKPLRKIGGTETDCLPSEDADKRNKLLGAADENDEVGDDTLTEPATKHKHRRTSIIKVLPAGFFVRKDGVKIFPHHLALQKPKPPKPLTKQEIDLRRRYSNVLFTTPAAVDEEARDDRRSRRIIQKIIRYLKRSWYVRLNRKNSMIVISHRLNQRLYHARPVDSWVNRRRREKLAERTGFFSSPREPFAHLGDLETDTAMIVLNNLPPDLRITATKWLRDLEYKWLLKLKRDTPLPRIPRARVKKPSYNKGRIKLDAGGQRMIEEFVRVAEIFQRNIKGSQTFAKILEVWKKHKDELAANRDSPFGVIRRQNLSNTNDDGEIPGENYRSGGHGTKKDSFSVDDRTFQREMHCFERMLSAMYCIIKSLLNMSDDQVTSKLPLPYRTVLALRAHSPENSKLVVKKAPPVILPKTTHPWNLSPESSKAVSITDIPRLVRTALASREDMFSELDVVIDEANIEPDRRHYITDDIPYMHKKKILKEGAIGIKSEFFDPEKLKPLDIINLSPPQSSRRALDAIKMVHSLKDMRNDSAEEKLGLIFETPKHEMLRQARNEATYLKLFHPGKKSRKPIWHHVKVGHFQDSKSKHKDKDLNAAPESNVAESLLDTTAIVEKALIKRHNMQSQRFPDEDDITTPELPGAISKEKITSEEQSRLNLLKKVPNAASQEPPSTPIRRLYKMANICTTDKDFYQTLMEMKRPFRNVEKKLKLFYENEIEKFEWATMKRYRVKLNAMTPGPIWQKTIARMRNAMLNASDNLEQSATDFKRTAPWYRKLSEEAEQLGAFLHHGCQTNIHKLKRYCDVDMKSRPHMLSRFCLLVVSLPVTELGEPHWQKAILFVLEQLLAAPSELFLQWLQYRNLPYVI